MKESFIGLIADDTPALFIGLLAILKSGNTFVPINPVFPEERIRFLINDCSINILLTDNANLEKARRLGKMNPGITHILCINHLVEGFKRDSFFKDKRKSDFCYVIYTSGSTGRPKGVPIAHWNLIPLFYWFREYFQLGIHTRILKNLSYTFDFGVFEILTTLLFGGRIYIADKTDFSQYPEFINKHPVLGGVEGQARHQRQAARQLKDTEAEAHLAGENVLADDRQEQAPHTGHVL